MDLFCCVSSDAYYSQSSYFPPSMLLMTHIRGVLGFVFSMVDVVVIERERDG